MGSEEFKIKVVKDGQEKYNLYKTLSGRLKQARKYEFNLEAFWILYAMLEDRTSAFLYYAGFTSDKDRRCVTSSKRYKADIRRVLNIPADATRYGFDSLGGKLQNMRQTLIWAEQEPLATDSPYLIQLRKNLNRQNCEKLMSTCKYLDDEWRDKRNQIMHALFNKNADAVAGELRGLVEDGEKAIRVIDNAARDLKRENNLRRMFKIR